MKLLCSLLARRVITYENVGTNIEGVFGGMTKDSWHESFVVALFMQPETSDYTGAPYEVTMRVADQYGETVYRHDEPTVFHQREDDRLGMIPQWNATLEVSDLRLDTPGLYTVELSGNGARFQDLSLRPVE